jgi:hypothetical protein
MRYLRRLAPVGGVVAAAVVALSATPAGATIVCPPGVKPPSKYCTNVKPTAITQTASNVKATSATLNGAAGAGVTGGDPTKYFFQYGTSTAYGKQTPIRTLGACSPGVTPPSSYCNTPSVQGVQKRVSGLTPCTTYHFQLVAFNHDGKTKGRDNTFTTGFAKPIKSVKSPKTVKPGHRFKVTIALTYAVKDLKIFIKKKNGRIVKAYDFGPQRAGTFSKKIRAPRKRGTYTLEVRAKLSCGSQSVKKKLKVH